MVKKILITGANGFVGKNLIEFYSDKPNINIITFIKTDNLKDKLNLNPDIIINTAASIYDIDCMFDTNVALVNKLIEYSKKTRCKLIQIGSSAEYGKKILPTKETDFLDPVTFYGGTKAAATLLCKTIAQEFNLPIVIARPYSLYGNYEKPYRLFGRLYDAFVNNKPMNLYEGYHDFIYIKDFILGIDYLVQNDLAISGDIINYGTGIQTSNIELFKKFAQIFNSKPDCITFMDGMSKSFESKTWVCDTHYAKTRYNFMPKYSLENGIKDFIKTKQGYLL